MLWRIVPLINHLKTHYGNEVADGKEEWYPSSSSMILSATVVLDNVDTDHT